MKKERSTGNILIISNDGDALQELANGLGATCTFDITESCEDGLSMALTGAYKLILIDADIPQDGGICICHEIRARLTVPIIMISAEYEGEREIKCFDGRSRSRFRFADSARFGCGGGRCDV